MSVKQSFKHPPIKGITMFISFSRILLKLQFYFPASTHFRCKKMEHYLSRPKYTQFFSGKLISGACIVDYT